jgi:1,4-alpha-glucan branching enzyme
MLSPSSRISFSELKRISEVPASDGLRLWLAPHDGWQHGEDSMIKKAYTKTGRSCRVTFAVPAEVDAQAASLCGEFNGWDKTSHPMKRRKDGSFSLTVSLAPGRQYRFRYVLDGDRWENEQAADGYLPNPFGSQDSLIKV